MNAYVWVATCYHGEIDPQVFTTKHAAIQATRAYFHQNDVTDFPAPDEPERRHYVEEPATGYGFMILRVNIS